MQSKQNKQFDNVLHAELMTPMPLRWEYQTADSAEWIETDSANLLFKLIPSGTVTSYRQKTDGVL